jgi:hypothetical protein
MRTTLSLDEDVAAMLERLRKTRDENFKDLVNGALRRGLRQMAARPRRREPFKTRAVSLGRCKLGGIDNISEVLATAEDESFK